MDKNVLASTKKSDEIDDVERQFKIKAAIFLSGISGLSALIGFGATVASARKQDPKYFSIGMTPMKELPETGASLALRALGWGSLYAFVGCGVLFYSIWKISGANNMQEFRYKMGSVLPTIPKNTPPQGRTEFSGLNDLLDYLQHQRGVKDK
ncbi:unnamed protein product [Psylliodes chrysocephalus]|uniref:Transmembrane protein 242 n=1 Tax=Psylliodes chrysocephalus TaxID=3402493 RepID=A0A9P0D3I6_9CUCU|nr:unnamed protein product [Psylliodes chrysocephala]